MILLIFRHGVHTLSGGLISAFMPAKPAHRLANVITTHTPPKLGGEAVSSCYLVPDATTCRSQMKEKDRT